MVVAIGAARDSVTGQVQTRAVGKLRAPVEGILDRSKGTRAIDTDRSMLQRCRGGWWEACMEVQVVER